MFPIYLFTTETYMYIRKWKIVPLFIYLYCLNVIYLYYDDSNDNYELI